MRLTYLRHPLTAALNRWGRIPGIRIRSMRLRHRGRGIGALNLRHPVSFLAAEQCTVTIFKDQVHDSDTDDSGPNTDTLNADYVATFTVSTGTAPPYLPSVHTTFGNPSNAVADPNQPNNYLMEKP